MVLDIGYAPLNELRSAALSIWMHKLNGFGVIAELAAVTNKFISQDASSGSRFQY